MKEDFIKIVKVLLENKKNDRPDFSWNKAISSGMFDYNKTQTKLKTETTNKTFIEELEELIAKARKSGADEITGLLVARQLYLKHNK